MTKLTYDYTYMIDEINKVLVLSVEELKSKWQDFQHIGDLIDNFIENKKKLFNFGIEYCENLPNSSEQLEHFSNCVLKIHLFQSIFKFLNNLS